MRESKKVEEPKYRQWEIRQVGSHFDGYRDALFINGREVALRDIPMEHTKDMKKAVFGIILDVVKGELDDDIGGFSSKNDEEYYD